MALTFNGNGWLEMAWGTAPGLPLTIFAYLKQTQSTTRIAASSGAFTTESLVLEIGSLASNGFAFTQHRTAGSSRSATSALALTSNTWTPLLGHGQTAAPGTETVVGASSAVTTEASTRVATTHTRFRVGATAGTDAPSSTNYIGDLAEIAIWKGLTQAEAEAIHAAIVAGTLVNTLQVAKLVDVWPLTAFEASGNYVGIVNGLVLTANGTGISQAANHPVTRAGDTTAPVLSSPTGAATGATTATGGATTNEAGGTIYTVWTTDASTPSDAQVKAGQSSSGAPAAASANSGVSSTGARTNNATGLTASTSYYAHSMHEDAAGNKSNVVTSASFTTSAASGVKTSLIYFYRKGNGNV